MNEPRTVTLTTTDHGSVTIPEPSWCVGHVDHRPGRLCDVLHCGPAVTLRFGGRHLAHACLVQAPHGALEDRTPAVSVEALTQTLDVTGLYALAAAYDGHADRLRGLADQLAAILEGGAR